MRVAKQVNRLVPWSFDPAKNYALHCRASHTFADTMVDSDALDGVDKPEGEGRLDLKEPTCEDTEGCGDVGGGDLETAAAASETQCPSEEAKNDRAWKWSVAFLCFYGFMASIKPGEPFITPYLLSVEKNFTREQVSDGHSVCV